MCRSNGDGGRRCPSCAPEARNAGRRAGYAAQRAERAAREEHELRTDTTPVPPPDVPAGPPTIEQARVLAQEAAALAATGTLLEYDWDHETHLPTTHGTATETAVRRAGEAIDLIADGRAQIAVAEIDQRWARQTGHPDRESWAAALQQAEQAVGLAWKQTADRIDADERAATVAGLRPRDENGRYTPEAREAALQALRPLRAFNDAREAAREAAYEARTGKDAWAAERLAARSEALRSVLADIRPMGPTGPLTVHPKSARPQVKTLTEAVGYFPTAWVDASEKNKLPLFVRSTKVRAHYQHGHSVALPPTLEWSGSQETLFYGETDTPEKKKAELETKRGTRNVVAERVLDKDGNPAFWKNGTEQHRVTWEKEVLVHRSDTVGQLLVGTDTTPGRPPGFSSAIHEAAHRAEATGDGTLGQVQHAFLVRRATLPGHDGPPPLTLIYPHKNKPKKDAEKGWEDSFGAGHYVGKQYSGTTHREVLSMGVEALFAGRSGGLRGENGHKPDLEHRHLVIGMLASL